MTSKKSTYEDPPEHILFGSQEHLEWGQVSLFKQTEILQKIHDEILNPKDSKAMVIAMSLISIIETSRSVLLLARHNVRDSYALSRILLDSTLNLGYYSVDDEMVKKALQYLHQKSFRDMFRELDLETMNASNKLDEDIEMTLPQNLMEAFTEFTNGEGTEIRNWYGAKRKDVFKRIKIIEAKHGEKIGKILNLCVFSIYRHSSEIIHGTLFGTCYGIGLTENNFKKPLNKDEHMEYINQMNAYLMSILNLMMETIVRIINVDYPIEDLLKESNGYTTHLNTMVTKQE